MARRNNAKLRKAHHNFMLDAEREALEKANRRAQRRALRRQCAKDDALLADIMTSTVRVDEQTKSAVPLLGAPIVKDTDASMDPLRRSKHGRIRKKSKKSAERAKKIKRRLEQSSAMQL